MRELTLEEIEEVSGGLTPLGGVLLVTGAVIGYGLAMAWNSGGIRSNLLQ